jgi:hypothetical protein
VAFRLSGDDFVRFVQRVEALGLKNHEQRPVTIRSVVDHDMAYSVYFSDPYGHRLEVTTYDYHTTRTALGPSVRA